jgi:DNA-binding CsgD family transcriptional regulator
MSEAIGISSADLRVILDVVDPDRCGEAGEHVPDSVLHDLAQLVPYDDATFQVMDPYQRMISIQSLEPEPELAADADVDALWWPAFWEHCGYPLRSGDYARVIRGSDVLPGQASGPAWRAFLEASPESGSHQVIVSLPPTGSTDRRLILWRTDGPDFSDRDVQLLTLLRPHLIAMYERHQQERAGAPELTLRQWEILRMVADGATNGLIARRLGLSEATVRKHLENTFTRLGVTNRTAAVGRTRRFLQAG